MNKKKISIILCITLLFILAGVFYLTQNHKIEQDPMSALKEAGTTIPFTSDDDEEEGEFDLQGDIKKRLVKRSDRDVIWTVSDDAIIYKRYLKLFNRKLKEDGFDIQLKFQYLDEEHYNEEIREVLKNGDTDIALGGQDEGLQNVVAQVCRDGLLLKLDSLLETDSGKALREEYEEPLWGSVEVDGSVYTIPNGIYDDGRYCIVFNNQYIDTEQSKNFSGDIATLDSYMTEEIKEDPKGKELLSLWGSSDLANVLGYYEAYGAFFDSTTGEIQSPFACQEVYTFLKMLHNLQMENCVAMESTLYGDGPDNNKKIKDKIRNKEFSILLTRKSDILKEIEEDVTVVELDFTVNFARVGGTSGICAKSEKAEEALQLLSLLHTQEEYAHLLLYGREGVDYELKTGRILTEKGAGIWTIDALGIFRSAYPDENDTVYTGNIRKQKRELYRSSHCKTSVVSGFQIDEKEFTKEELKKTQLATTFFDVWKQEDFEKKYEEAKKDVGKETRGILTKLKQQLEIWKETVK